MLVPTEATVIYQSELKLIDVAYEISLNRSMRKPEVRKLIRQGTNIFLWLQAYQAASFLTREEREKIWVCLLDIADVNNFAVAPVLGQTNQPSVFVGQANNITNNVVYDAGVPFINGNVDTGTETVDSFILTVAYGAVWHYTVRKPGNQRSGIVQASWTSDGANVVWQHDSTNDIGDTSPVTIVVDYSAGLIRFRAVALSDDWIVEGNRYLIYAPGSGVSAGSGDGGDIDGGTA